MKEGDEERNRCLGRKRKEGGKRKLGQMGQESIIEEG